MGSRGGVTEISPPRDLYELAARAQALSGCELAELFERLGRPVAQLSTRTKGKVGELIEHLLGASAGCLSIPDFPALGVELKTIPVDARGRARESTFVCTLPLAEADRLDWASSPVCCKLAHVLWVPIELEPVARVGTPFFWRPTPEQESVLRSDFEEIVGLVAIGHVEHLTARAGRYLQARPKAAHSGARTRAYGADGEPLQILPRGFYLRARFTREIMREALGRADAVAGRGSLAESRRTPMPR